MDYIKLRKELLMRTAKYHRAVDNLYDSALERIAKLFVDIDIDGTEPFSFDRYGKFNSVDEIMSQLEKHVQSLVDDSIRKEFAKSYHNVDALIDEVVKGEVSERIVKRLSPKIASNVAANTFIKATASGNITASTKVWNGAVLGQMESAVHDAMLEGMPAARMATHIKQFLDQPDEFFRRYRIKVGEDASGKSMYGRKWKKRLTLADGSHKWTDADPRDYPVGKGVYHSSYRNALRYAGTSTNIAYRTADYQRYQDLPFVIGIEIKTSQTNHTVSDICDELKGKYPKDFKWTGWHPNCRCYQVPILAKQSEVDEMVDDILDGGDGTNVKCKGVVTDTPTNFKAWLQKNADRYKLAEANGTLPYFIRDNRASCSLRNMMSMDGVSFFGISELSDEQKRFVVQNIDFLCRDKDVFGKKINIVFSKSLANGVLMQIDDNVLSISTIQYKLKSGQVFCQSDKLISAFKKLNNRQELSFFEEYSIETLFHEGLHSKAKGLVYIKQGSFQEVIMEVCTQLYAREKYDLILRKFGVRAVNKDLIRDNGLGYHDTCIALRPLFKKNNTLQLGELKGVALETIDGYEFLLNRLSKGMTREKAENALIRILQSRVV